MRRDVEEEWEEDEEAETESYLCRPTEQSLPVDEDGTEALLVDTGTKKSVTGLNLV